MGLRINTKTLKCTPGAQVSKGDKETVGIWERKYIFLEDK